MMDGGGDGVGSGGEHRKAGAVFLGVLPESGHLEPPVLRVTEQVGGLLSHWSGPFIVGDEWNEAASLCDGLAPHRAGQVIAPGIVDRS